MTDSELTIFNRSNEPYNIQVTFNSPGGRPVAWDPFALMPQATSDLFKFQGDKLSMVANGTSSRLIGSLEIPNERKWMYIHVVTDSPDKNPDISLIGIELRDAETIKDV